MTFGFVPVSIRLDMKIDLIVGFCRLYPIRDENKPLYEKGKKENQSKSMETTQLPRMV